MNGSVPQSALLGCFDSKSETLDQFPAFISFGSVTTEIILRLIGLNLQLDYESQQLSELKGGSLSGLNV